VVTGDQTAGVSLGRGGRFSTPAATEEAVRTVDALQYRLGSGPCVDAIVQDTTTFNAADLRTDPRWPQFGRTAYEQTGIVSMLSSRMSSLAAFNIANPPTFGDQDRSGAATSELAGGGVRRDPPS